MNAYLATLCTFAARSQAKRLLTYQLIGGLGFAYALLFLLIPLLVTGSSGILGDAWRAVQDMGWLLIVIGIISVAFAGLLLGAKLTGAIAAIVGLCMFGLVWSPEALRTGLRSAVLLPFACYFMFRANSAKPLVPILVAAASVFVLFVSFNDPHVKFHEMNITLLHVMQLLWVSFVSVCVINLLLALWSDHNPPQERVMATSVGQWLPPASPQLALPQAADAPALESAPLSLEERRARGVALRQKNQPVFQYKAVWAKHTLYDLVGMDDVKARLSEAGHEALKADKSNSNGILLYGPPGNGKTYLAEALAGSLDIPMIHYDFGQAASKYVNQTTENAMKVFADAVGQAPCVLFIDEVEAILSERSEQGLGATEYPKTVSALLTQLVYVRKRGVVVVAATNHIDLVDSAASREGRFDTKIEIPHPDAPARSDLIIKTFNETVQNTIELRADIVESLTGHWDGFSVSRICAVVSLVGRRLFDPLAASSEPTIEKFQKALREVQGSHGDIVLTNVTGLDQLHFDGSVGQQLSDLAGSMQNTFQFERLGGRVIGGALFYGPPGTGKTIAASAIAKSAGWAMIASNGTDLAREPEKIKKLIARAIELKPCIVFIDEADALISDRSKNWNSMATNAFLAQTGDDRASLRDVLFIAATNHPEGADSAMVRGGRFGEHIEFTLPKQETILSYLRAEALKSPVLLTEEVLLAAGSTMVGMPLSDVGGALKRACNRAASRAMKQSVTHADAERAILDVEDFLK